MSEGQDAEPTTKAPKADLAALHERFIRQIDDVIRVQMPMRTLALAARRFAAVPGAQWEDQWGIAFENSIRVEINKTARGLRKIRLDYLANRIVPSFRNVGSQADEHTANTIGGLHRADNYRFKAQQGRDNAFNEASSGGFGAYRLKAEYDDPDDKDSDDQRINPGAMIADADQRVFFDPNSILYDKSDARWGAVLTAMSPDAFAEDYPDASPVTLGDTIWKPYYEWFRPEQIIIAEFYRKEEVSEKLWVFRQENIQNGDEQRWWDSEISSEERAELRKQGYLQTSQNRNRKRIRKYTLSGSEIISDDGFIAGCEIPIVPVYGNWEYIDGVERFTGHVQLAMDPQRVYNAQISKLVETAAQSPNQKPIFDPEQMPPNLQALWAVGNIERHPYALAKALRNESGAIIQAGPIGSIEPAKVDENAAALIQITASDIAELTNANDGADEVRSNVSAEAMDIAATRIDAKSGVYIDHMRQSVQREGEIYLSLAKGGVYTREGREVDVTHEDESDGTETLVEGFTGPDGAFQFRNDLSKGRYKVIASVTEASDTLRDKTVRRLFDMAKTAIEAQDQELAQACLLTAFANMDGEGIADLQDWNRRRMLQLGLVKPTPEEAQMLAQMQQEKAQQPDPQAAALMAQAQDFMADAGLKGAKAEESKASSILKLAQAQAVGGPEQAPRVPSGLDAPPSPLDNAQQAAEIAKTHAETRKIHNDIDNPSSQGA